MGIWASQSGGGSGGGGPVSVPTTVTVQLPRFTVLASAIGVIDDMDATVIRSAKWMVTIKSSDGKFRAFELIALNKNSDVDFVAYGIVGDEMQIDLIGELSSRLTIKVFNKGSSDLTVDVVRINTTAI